MLKLPCNIRDEMIDLAVKESPIEACGYLAGTMHEAGAIFPLTNIDRSPEHFSFDPCEQFQVLKKARERGLDLIAVYHSHPATPARLSEEDIKLAYDPDIFYIIVSLLSDSPDLKAFKVKNKQVLDIPIKITKGDLDERSGV